MFDPAGVEYHFARGTSPVTVIAEWRGGALLWAGRLRGYRFRAGYWVASQLTTIEAPYGRGQICPDRPQEKYSARFLEEAGFGCH